MKKTKTILVVDDESQTCIQLSKNLSVSGEFIVLTALTGTDAINVIKDSGKEIDLVLTDMYMPKGTGFDVASYIRSKKLDIDIIIMSGGDRAVEEENYSVENDFVIDAAQKYGRTKFLKKPFSTEELLKVIASFK